MSKKIGYLEEKVKRFEMIGFEPIGRMDLFPVIITTPFNWGADPFQDNNWCFQLNTLRYLMIYCDLFDETKNIVYIDKLLDYLYDWYTFTSHNENLFAWHDMATGIRAEKISNIMDILKKNNIPMPTWLNSMVLEHIKKMREKNFINIKHNHGLYVIHGLRSLSKYVGPGMKKNILESTKNMIVDLLNFQYDQNFIHREHSPHYHHLITDSLSKLLKTGLYNDIEYLERLYAGALANKKYFYLPDGREVPFGDTDGEWLKDNKYSTQDNDSWDFFNKSGYFIAKKLNGSYIALTNNYNSNVHKHSDNLSLILGFQGKDILSDPGKYKYTNDNIRSFILSSESHNVVNHKKTPWGLKDIQLPISQFHLDINQEYFVTQGFLKLQINKKIVDWKREVVVHKDGFVVVIDIIKKNIENMVTRFLIDPSQILKNKEANQISSEFFQGEDFLLKTYSMDNKNILNKNILKLSESPISKKYGEFILTNQIEIEFKEENNISIFILDKSLKTDMIENFVKKYFLDRDNY